MVKECYEDVWRMLQVIAGKLALVKSSSLKVPYCHFSLPCKTVQTPLASLQWLDF